MAHVASAVAAVWLLMVTSTAVLADFNPHRDGTSYKLRGFCEKLDFWGHDVTKECGSKVLILREDGNSIVGFVWEDDWRLDFKGVANWRIDRYGDRVLQLSVFRQHGPGPPLELDGFGYCRLTGRDPGRPDRISCQLGSLDGTAVSAEFKIVGEAELLQ